MGRKELPKKLHIKKSCQGKNLKQMTFYKDVRTVTYPNVKLRTIVSLKSSINLSASAF